MTQFACINHKHMKISTTTYNKSMLAIYCSIAITITGCSTLPKHKIEPIQQSKIQQLEINTELKINENEHEMLGDEKEEKQDKSPDKNSPERC